MWSRSRSLLISNFNALRHYANHSSSSQFTTRTHNCGELRLANAGQTVELCGWLDFNRSIKKVHFLVIRDAYGKTQAIIKGDNLSKLKTTLESLTYESVLRIAGIVCSRGKDINPKMETGEVEIDVDRIEILNSAPPDLPVNSDKYQVPSYKLQAKYRYLYLRREEMQKAFRFRSLVTSKIRRYFENLNFVEIETPTLTQWTPGGANEFIVPAPAPNLGKFYTLPQSPQIYKQLLMCSGFDRYFQVARCYRDEGTKPDRQPEFTQVDFELSFTTQDNVMQIVEQLIKTTWPDDLGSYRQDICETFPKMTYEQVMRDYGTDKPDLRIPWKLMGCPENLSSSLLKSVADKTDFSARMFIAKGVAKYCTPDQQFEWKKLIEEIHGHKSFDMILFHESKWFKNWDSDIDEQEMAEKFNIEKEDVIVFCWGKSNEVNLTLGHLRNWLGDVAGLRATRAFKFLWVVDFPLFVKSDSGKLESAHHPFTASIAEDVDRLWKMTDLDNITAQHYDLVLNGVELGGGSIRIHDPKLQTHVFNNILKLPTKYLALSYGAPPHGGFALGLDRFISVMLNEGSVHASINNVIAFPKSVSGRCPMMKAPSLAQSYVLDRYGIEVPKHVKDDMDKECPEDDLLVSSVV